MSKPYQGGLFNAPVTCATMDPYIDTFRTQGRPHGSSKGLAQFGVSVKGIPGKFNRLYEGETYSSSAKESAKDRMKGREKFLTPSGFRHASPIKKSSSKGDFFGTFSRKAPPYISDGTYGQRGTRDAIKESGPKNFYTNPPRKATGDALGTTPKTCFEELHYIPSNYDAFEQTERASRASEREKVGDRVPFKVRGQDVLTPVVTEAPEGMRGNPPTHATRRPKEEAAEGSEVKAFRPSSPTKEGGPIYGTFSKYPVHEVDPFDEKKIMKASMSGRLLPMATQFEGMDEKIRERRPWTPSSPAKQMFTKSTMM